MKIRDEWNHYTYGCHMMQERPSICEFLWLNIKEWCLGLRCKIKGHDMQDDGSYAGPNSGVDSYCCSRCGYSWTHTHY